MSQTDQNTSDILEEDKTDLRASEGFLGPDLSFSLYGNGYTEATELRGEQNIFSTPSQSLNAYDELSEDNVVLEPGESARVFENYFGQYSFGSEDLETYLEDEKDSVNRFMSDIEDLEGSIVMDVDLFDYNGSQHVEYSEGRVSRELVDYLLDAAPEDLVLMDVISSEESSRLFIRSNP